MKFIGTIIVFLFLATSYSTASENDTTVTFDVQKMTCATCPISVKQAMKRVEGVKEVKVDLDSNSAVVTFDADVTTVEEIGSASSEVGFPVAVREK